MEKKKIFIINGAPGSGKTTFAFYCKQFLEKNGAYLYTTSIIDPIKSLVKKNKIWDGSTKDSKTRDFLSNLKDLLTDYCNYPMYKLADDVDNRLFGEYIAAFIDMREPEDIRIFKEAFENKYDIKTVLVRKQGDLEIANTAGNHADKQVFNYKYDITVFNYETLERLEETAHTFVDTYILKKNN